MCNKCQRQGNEKDKIDIILDIVCIIAVAIAIASVSWYYMLAIVSQ